MDASSACKLGNMFDICFSLAILNGVWSCFFQLLECNGSWLTHHALIEQWQFWILPRRGMILWKCKKPFGGWSTWLEWNRTTLHNMADFTNLIFGMVWYGDALLLFYFIFIFIKPDIFKLELSLINKFHCQFVTISKKKN